VVGERRLTVVTNPGDDLLYAGGEVWPDFDLVLYGLAGVFDEAQGWGIAGDSYTTLGWFRMGDADLARSRRRAAWLAQGDGRDDVAGRLCEELDVDVRVVPATSGWFASSIEIARGQRVPFQEWLVRLRAAEPPLALTLPPTAPSPSAVAVAAIRAADVVILGPSSPVGSLAPILAVPAIRYALESAARIVAVSPTILGRQPSSTPERSRYRVREALLGTIGVEHTPGAIAALWEPLVDGFVLDETDADEARLIGVPTTTCDLLQAPAAAAATLELALRLSPRASPRRVPAVHGKDRARDEARRV
jgi:LPPG:FO 2-phospho-L-lactate transferase